MDMADVEKTIELAESITRKWGSIEGIPGDFISGGRDARRLTQVAVDLQKSMEQSVKISGKNSEQLIIKLQKLMQKIMKRLQMEFYTILCDSNSFMADLRSIADCMIACGYGTECVNVYKSVRRSIADEKLYSAVRAARFPGVYEMKKMEWKVLEEKMKRWIYLIQAAVNEVFHREKLLSRSVFSAKVAELCFGEICGDVAADLLRFPANFGNCTRIMLPEKVFRTLDMYEALAALLPKIGSMFSGRASAAIRSAAEEAAANLRGAARTMIGRFRTAIQEDSSKPPANGGIHPLARYVMNFLLFLDDYRVLISDVVAFFDPPRVSGGEDPPAIAWFVVALICKVNSKAAMYGDVGLGYLFLANNLNYVVSKIRNSNLKLSVGSEWISGHKSELSKYLSKYVESDWTGVVISPLAARDPTVEIPREEAGEIFRNFNSRFRETYGRNRTRVIPDPYTGTELVEGGDGIPLRGVLRSLCREI